MLAAAPFAGTAPAIARDSPVFVPGAERRFRPARGSEDAFAWIQVEVHLARSERRARAIWGTEAHDPFDGLVGEFYVTDSHPVDIPDELPGSVTTYETIVGAAGVEGIIHVGGFIRGTFVWIARVSEGPVDPVLDIADLIMAYDLPDATHARMDPGLLDDLLPDPEDLAVEVEIEDGS